MNSKLVLDMIEKEINIDSLFKQCIKFNFRMIQFLKNMEPFHVNDESKFKSLCYEFFSAFPLYIKTDSNLICDFDISKMNNIPLIHLGNINYLSQYLHKNPYIRFSIEEKIHNDYPLCKAFDIFEGILFHKSIPSWIEINIGGLKYKFNITGNCFMPKNFFIELGLGTFYTQLFITTDVPITCKMIYGSIKGHYNCSGITKNPFIYDKQQYNMCYGDGALCFVTLEQLKNINYIPISKPLVYPLDDSDLSGQNNQ